MLCPTWSRVWTSRTALQAHSEKLVFNFHTFVFVFALNSIFLYLYIYIFLSSFIETMSYIENSDLHQTVQHNLKILFWNIRSFQRRKNEVLSFVKNYDILIFVESWLYDSYELKVPGYNTFMKNRELTENTGKKRWWYSGYDTFLLQFL